MSELSGRDAARASKIMGLFDHAVQHCSSEEVLGVAAKAIRQDAGSKVREQFDLSTRAGLEAYVDQRVAASGKGANQNLRQALRAVVPKEARVGHGNKYRPEPAPEVEQQHATL